MKIFLFSVYGIFNVALHDVPKRHYSFLLREYAYFEVDELKHIHLDIHFVDKIVLPADSVYLKENFYYKEGIAYLYCEGSLLSVPLKDIPSPNMKIDLEKDIGKWFILYAVEKILHLKIIEKDYCFFHAAGIKKNGETIVNSSLQSGGKTKWVLGQLDAQAGFLGDDLVLANRQGYVRAYPRGLNIHFYHGKIYKECLKKSGFHQNIFNQVVLNLLRFCQYLSFLWPGMARRIGKKIKLRTLLRVSIRELIPDIEIISKSKLTEIWVSIRANVKCAGFREWSKKRLTLFLLQNINIEREVLISPYIEAFYAYGDQHSILLRKYITRLRRKEFFTIRRAVSRCRSKIMINPL